MVFDMASLDEQCEERYRTLCREARESSQQGSIEYVYGLFSFSYPYNDRDELVGRLKSLLSLNSYRKEITRFRQN